MSLILTVCVLLHTGSDAIYRRGFRGWAQGLKVGIRGVLWRHTNTLIMRSNSLLLRKPLLSQLKWNRFSLICYFSGDRLFSETHQQHERWGYLTFKVRGKEYVFNMTHVWAYLGNSWCDNSELKRNFEPPAWLPFHRLHVPSSWNYKNHLDVEEWERYFSS